MKKWFRDDLFTSILKNTGKLGSGKLVGALLGLGALVCTSRGMRPHDFGILTMIGAYAASVTSIAQFQGWQVVLHYASIPWQKGEKDHVKNAIRLAIGLDLSAGLVGMIGGMIAVILFGHQLGIHAHHKHLVLLYCTLIPGMGASSVYGILRLFDRVDIVARQQVATPFVRAIGSVIVWSLHGGLVGFVWAWYAGILAGQLYMWAGACVELYRRQMLDALRPSLFGSARHMPKGVWGFIWTASVTTMIETAWEPLTNLIIGRFLGTAASGMYALAMTFLDAVQRPAKLLEKSYYPEVVRLDPRTMRPWKLALRTSFLSALVGVLATALVYIGGAPVISMFGHRYATAAPLMTWMSPSLIFFMAGLSMEGVLYTAGRAKYIMYVQFISVLCYIPVLIFMCRHYGLNGAGLAYALGVLWLTLLTFVLTMATFIRRRHIIPPHEREMGA